MTFEKPRTKALAAGSAFAVLYTVFAISLALFPDFSAAFINSIKNGINLRSSVINNIDFTFGEYIVGLIYVMISGIMAGYVYGVINNALLRSEGTQIEITRGMTSVRT